MDVVGSYYLGNTHRALRDRSDLIIELLNSKKLESVSITELTAEIHKPLNISFETFDRDAATNPQKGKANSTISFSTQDALLDFDKLIFPLTLRKWQQGDKFMPLGMKGMKLVSDYLTDAKVPRNEKERTLVLMAGDQIIWLVGHRVDERFKVGDQTQMMYLARLEKDSEDLSK